jgi:hypothetical protein
MTEEIEAHVLKKYEILQKLGKYASHRRELMHSQRLITR